MGSGRRSSHDLISKKLSHSVDQCLIEFSLLISTMSLCVTIRNAVVLTQVTISRLSNIHRSWGNAPHEINTLDGILTLVVFI